MGANDSVKGIHTRPIRPLKIDWRCAQNSSQSRLIGSWRVAQNAIFEPQGKVDVQELSEDKVHGWMRKVHGRIFMVLHKSKDIW